METPIHHLNVINRNMLTTVDKFPTQIGRMQLTKKI
jgi:hypothetical protein